MKTAILLAVAGSALGRTFTVYNACPFTIWPAIFTDLNAGTSVPSIENGWEAPAYSKRAFTVPDDWKAGRIWGRTQCDFSKNPGISSCLTGGCNGGLACDNKTGVGLAPVTFAEFTLGASGQDYTDVSLVDGFNLPIRISNTAGCKTAECAVNLNTDCPEPLKGPVDANGTVAACKSACLAQISPPANSPSCCTGDFSTPATCPPSGVEYYSYFKQRCPYSYVYPYDESSGTSLLVCPSSKKADYTVTFCP
ncbi:pathogenesis-related protein PR5K (thaumatin family) [Rhizoctonia solani 123E]|uniref:Pathogenesis-related protein PR5K (Thaumatin family) n=1 Tax=Rhizoctonia solani 123E TaxID=1423351 RepID=A0A074SJU6_9AGAM|nr:pathogenesis-related protein PR5K (thaumatin family) [Rhizoctonia solani 123E]